MKKNILVVLNCLFLLQWLSAQEIKRIDTHLHLYDTNRPGSFDFLNDHKADGSDKLRFPHLAQQFREKANPAGVQFGYVVEASTRREDNFWLAQICDTSKCLVGFSANLNPLADTFIKDLDSLSKSPKFRGIRPRVGGINLSDPTTISRLGELEKRGLVLELWGNSSAIIAIARVYPKMNIIVNHFAGGSIRESGVPNEDSYKSKLAALAARPNIYIKISSLYTLSGQNPAPTNMAFYKPLIDAAVGAFGPDRVIFGSDWSLSDLRGNYQDMVKLLDEYCNSRSDLSIKQLFYTNAINAYGLKSFTTSALSMPVKQTQLIYPNPSSRKITVESQKPSGVEIFTLDGKEVFKCNMLKFNHEIQVDNFKAGVYLVKSINSEKIETQKLIIN